MPSHFVFSMCRWRVLPVQQREGIKSFLISLIIRLSTTAESFKEHQAYLKRLNLSLVQVYSDSRIVYEVYSILIV
jgi:hypothetical protein